MNEHRSPAEYKNVTTGFPNQGNKLGCALYQPTGIPGDFDLFTRPGFNSYHVLNIEES